MVLVFGPLHRDLSLELWAITPFLVHLTIYVLSSAFLLFLSVCPFISFLGPPNCPTRTSYWLNFLLRTVFFFGLLAPRWPFLFLRTPPTPSAKPCFGLWVIFVPPPNFFLSFINPSKIAAKRFFMKSEQSQTLNCHFPTRNSFTESFLYYLLVSESSVFHPFFSLFMAWAIEGLLSTAPRLLRCIQEVSFSSFLEGGEVV